MTDDPFRVDPEGRFSVWHISGGRTSGMMLRRLLDANGGTVPANADWWIAQEEKPGHFQPKKNRQYQFSERYTTRQLKAESQTPTIFDPTPPPEDEVSCFCGD